MATIEELEQRIARIEARLVARFEAHNTEQKSRGQETSNKIQQAAREYAKANRVVSISKIAKQLDLSTTRVYQEFKGLESQGVIESIGKGFGYLSKIYEGK
jgi:ribosomal protein S25